MELIPPKYARTQLDFPHYGETLHRPYQCFMGRWEGLCKTFSATGDFIESSPVHMNVYWTGPST